MRRGPGAAALAVVVAAVACRGDAGTAAPVPTSVSVSPATVTLTAIGATQPLTATVRDQNGRVLDGQTLAWSSTNASAASVSTSGVVTAVGNGSATIRAAVGGIAGAASVTVAQVVATLVKVSGDAQTGTVGAVLPGTLVVRANDANGNGVADVTVTLTVTQGGGHLSAPTQTTGPSGATGGATWTLGTTAGAPQQVAAAAPGAAPVTFAATATAGAAARISIAAGDGQSAPVGAAVPVPPAVLAQDAFDNPVSGVAVTFAVTGGGGSLTGADAVSNASGIATPGSWTLGTAAGSDNNTLQATAGGLAGSPLTFTASATPGAPSTIAVADGDNQSATVNTAVATAPAVIVRDQYGNPVPAVAVTFTVTGGGGTVSGGNALTDPAGVAAVTSWTLGTGAGTDNNTLEVVAADLPGSPVTLTASATAAAAAAVALDAGGGQTATVNTTVAVAPSVLVRDLFGNPVEGVSVTFAVTGGGGTVTGGTATSGMSGIATVGSWTLGTAAGTDNNVLQATSAGLAGSPVTFTASATAGPAAQITKATGDAQTATAGTALPVSPAAFVGDAFDNPVAGVTVTFAVTTGGGSVIGATPASGPDGLAAVGSWTLGPTPGPNALSATASGLGGSPLAFTATGTPGSASSIALAGGDAQTDTVAATLPLPYAVLVTDSAANPVPDVAVTWAVTGGGGSLAPASSVTDASGIATATRTLGPGAGVQTATAVVSGLTGSPVQFTATATSATAVQLALDAGDGQSAPVNTAVAVAPSVRVQDQFGNPVEGVAVTFAVTGGGGSVTGGNATSGVSGIATVGSWTLGTTAGSDNNTLAATSAGLSGSPVTFTASATAGPAASVAVHAGDNQAGPAGAGLPVDPAVIVRDAFANPVTSAIVTFAVTQGGGSVAGAVDTTGSDGVATSGEWILGAPGTNQLTATVTGAGITGNPVTFTATATGGSASVAMLAGDGQTGLVGFAVNVAPAVIVRDAASAPVAGVQVDFAVTGGGGAVTGASAVTGADGVATVGSWVLGPSPGANALSATVAAAGVSGNPVPFGATGASAQYDIEVRFLTPVTAAQRAPFDSAEARWERMLYGDLIDIPFNRGPTNCAGVQIPGVHETVDDLLIFVSLDSIDGPFNVLGAAGPCFIRGADTLPVIGVMQFDTADVAFFLAQGQFDEIVMHEMGHIIGFGTLWTLKGRLQDPSLSGGADPHFDGPEAVAAFDRSGGEGYSGGAKVPVENTGGIGTADGHWREAVFDSELMTGFLNDGANPMSVISIASLADIGYARANYAASDPYVVASALLRARVAPGIRLGPHMYLGEVTFVDAQGRPRGTARLGP